MIMWHSCDCPFKITWYASDFLSTVTAVEKRTWIIYEILVMNLYKCALLPNLYQLWVYLTH